MRAVPWSGDSGWDVGWRRNRMGSPPRMEGVAAQTVALQVPRLRETLAEVPRNGSVPAVLVAGRLQAGLTNGSGEMGFYMCVGKWAGWHWNCVKGSHLRIVLGWFCVAFMAYDTDMIVGQALRILNANKPTEAAR